MDDLLRDTLRTRAADPAAACLDPEAAAAFVDGTMAARARTSAEAHVADCARCQAVLAALVRSTPPPVERAWWRRPAVAWLAPLTVAATAVAIWINVPDTPSDAPPPTLRVEAPPLASSPVQTAPAEAPPAAQEPSQLQAAARLAAAVEAQRAREVADASAKARLTRATAETVADNRDARKTAAPQVGAVQPARPSVPAEALVAVSAPPPPPSDSLAVARSVARTQQTTIISPNRMSQWRIGADGALQHSADGGMTWQVQATGVDLTPTAGSSPSPTVCWLVGPGGLVLITSDEGQSWRRVPFPVVTDLVAVRAGDDRSATVVSSDGRAFVTSDAGRTWKP